MNEKTATISIVPRAGDERCTAAKWPQRAEAALTALLGWLGPESDVTDSEPAESGRALRALDGLPAQAPPRPTDELAVRNSLLQENIAVLEQEVAKAYRFAYHDELTGLPNRRLLLDRFTQVVARDARRHEHAVLLFLDLDGFKRLNDTQGHVIGDKVLQQVAARLTACVRASDTACRYGGDEFVVLLPEFKSQVRAVAAAEKIRMRLAMPYTMADSALAITTSIGMAIYPRDGCALDDLIQTADRAMYQNKCRLAPPSVSEAQRSAWPWALPTVGSTRL
jgi:diguanylate cyclase (GGDEF)-like protein